MAAEVNTLLHALHMRIIIEKLLRELLKREIELDTYVKSQTLLIFLVKSWSTSKSLLQTDVYVSKNAYKKGVETHSIYTGWTDCYGCVDRKDGFGEIGNAMIDGKE